MEYCGGMTNLDQAAIYGKSSNQTLVPKSATKGNLVGVSDYYTGLDQHQKFLIVKGYQPGVEVIYQDNQRAISQME